MAHLAEILGHIFVAVRELQSQDRLPKGDRKDPTKGDQYLETDGDLQAWKEEIERLIAQVRSRS